MKEKNQELQTQRKSYIQLIKKLSEALKKYSAVEEKNKNLENIQEQSALEIQQVLEKIKQENLEKK
jgi:hypothetical protein